MSICQKYEVSSLACLALQLSFVLDVLECHYDFRRSMSSDPKGICSKARAVRRSLRLYLSIDVFKLQLLRGHSGFHDVFKCWLSLQLR